MDYLYIFFGGGTGALLRFIVSKIFYKKPMGFPLGTFLVNIGGAFFIGLLSAVAEKRGLSKGSLLFLQTGLCGGFTTFSTFSLETIKLIHGGKYAMALMYSLSSLCLCLAFIALAQFLVKQ